MTYEAGFNEVDTNDVQTGITYAQQLNVWTESGKKALDEIKPGDEDTKRLNGLLPGVDIIGGAADGAVKVNLIGDGNGEMTLTSEAFAPLVNPVDQVLMPGGHGTKSNTDNGERSLTSIETINGVTFQVAEDKESVTQINPDGSQVTGLTLDMSGGNGTFKVTNPQDGSTQTYYNDGHFESRDKDGKVTSFGNLVSNGVKWGVESVAFDRASNTVTVKSPGGEKLVQQVTNFSIGNTGTQPVGQLASAAKGTVLEDNTVVFMSENGSTALLSPAGADVFQNSQYAHLVRTPGRSEDTMRFLYAQDNGATEMGAPFAGLESNVGVSFNENYAVVFSGHEAWQEGSWGYYSPDGVPLVTGGAPKNQEESRS